MAHVGRLGVLRQHLAAPPGGAPLCQDATALYGTQMVAAAAGQPQISVEHVQGAPAGWEVAPAGSHAHWSFSRRLLFFIIYRGGL